MWAELKRASTVLMMTVVALAVLAPEAHATAIYSSSASVDLSLTSGDSLTVVGATASVPVRDQVTAGTGSFSFLALS
jgi:hypothetical protein